MTPYYLCHLSECSTLLLHCPWLSSSGHYCMLTACWGQILQKQKVPIPQLTRTMEFALTRFTLLIHTLFLPSNWSLDKNFALTGEFGKFIWQKSYFQFFSMREDSYFCYWICLLPQNFSFIWSTGGPLIKLRHCEKATKFEKISHLFWHSLSNVKTSGRFSQIFVAF